MTASEQFFIKPHSTPVGLRYAPRHLNPPDHPRVTMRDFPSADAVRAYMREHHPSVKEAPPQLSTPMQGAMLTEQMMSAPYAKSSETSAEVLCANAVPEAVKPSPRQRKQAAILATGANMAEVLGNLQAGKPESLSEALAATDLVKEWHALTKGK